MVRAPPTRQAAPGDVAAEQHRRIALAYYRDRPLRHRTPHRHLLVPRRCNGAGEVEPAARSVMIESPTGSGKTLLGLLVAKVLQQQTGVSVGWVAMRRNLLQQADAENCEKGINVYPIRFLSMFEKQPPTDIDAVPEQ